MKQNTDAWTAIRIPRAFKDSIDLFLIEHPELGYRSVAQFLVDSGRRRLEELNAALSGAARGAVE
ncbi:MAG: hypothetical protein GXO25_05960 [Euryarchaeota archaeon]|nr:hypothetical protein [Euryarchaeota archaeon]